jgi:hypothetical protein
MFSTIVHVFGHFENELILLFALLGSVDGSKSDWIMFDLKGKFSSHLWSGGCCGDFSWMIW